MSIVSYKIIDSIGVITLNNPPVNALSQALREGMKNAIESAQEDDSKALVILCEGSTFIAGADIAEFGKPPKEPSLPDVLTVIENSQKLVIAALHGMALGGGFETALACHYRCAVATAKMGLPEAKLGLLPGAGGTQRVPRLTGVKAALDIITVGDPISAVEGENLNLIDRVIEGELLDGAVSYAKELIANQASLRRVRDLDIDRDRVNNEIFERYRERLARKKRGQIAPQHIVSCVEAAVKLPIEEGLAEERRLFEECLHSEQSAAMRHLFFAERKAAKVEELPKGSPVRVLTSAAVIGSGTMGAGIAVCLANAGIQVKILDVNRKALEVGLAKIRDIYDAALRKNILSEKAKDAKLSLIEGCGNYEDLADVDLVVEAVFEKLDTKREVFAELDKVCKPGAILATNTSYQDVNAIAAVTNRPEDVLGLHFFSPAHVMKLLEVVRGEKTENDVIVTAMKLAKRINKIPVLAGVCYGFIGNRMYRQYIREANLILIEGASPEQIDSAMEGWGMAMGPMAVGDLSGLDIGYNSRQALLSEQKFAPHIFSVADALVESGRLGQKTGMGYYTYDSKTRARISDPAVMAIVEQQAEKYGIERREIGDTEIRDRLIYALINEGAKILEEKIAQRPSDIDIVYVFGYGFPIYRGGPMYYADSIGLQKVYDNICTFREQYGEENWEPAALLEELAKQDKGFCEWATERGGRIHT